MTLFAILFLFMVFLWHIIKIRMTKSDKKNFGRGVSSFLKC